jgi:hypothetical protein
MGDGSDTLLLCNPSPAAQVSPGHSRPVRPDTTTSHDQTSIALIEGGMIHCNAGRFKQQNANASTFPKAKCKMQNATKAARCYAFHPASDRRLLMIRPFCSGYFYSND